MGADKSAENTPNAPNLFAQVVCPSPKVWDFDEKRLLWVSVVRDTDQHLLGQPPCLIQNQARRKVRKFGEGCQGIMC